MRRTLLGVCVMVAAVSIGACARQTSEGSHAADRAGVAVPANSPLAKIHLGMAKKDVRGVLGEPDDENSYMTGKAFIPFYFGNDTRRTSWYYKGIGRVVFADGNAFGGGGNEVVRIDHDPSESGRAR